MEELIKKFPHAVTREYKGGVEFRTRNLDHDAELAEKIIRDKKLNLEIFEKDAVLSSFSVREKK